jgi:hypothetical protein
MDDDTKDLNILSNEVSDDALEARRANGARSVGGFQIEIF